MSEEKRKIYKSEDAQTIYEYLKEYDAETEKRKSFSSALKRELLKGYYAQEKINKIEGRQQDSSWDEISK